MLFGLLKDKSFEKTLFRNNGLYLILFISIIAKSIEIVFLFLSTFASSSHSNGLILENCLSKIKFYG